MRALHRAPLAPSVADDDDQRRRLGPSRAAPLSLHRFVSGHLIGRMAQLEDALLLHPEDKIGAVLGIAAEKVLLHLGILDYDVFPGLRVSAGHRPAPGLENLFDVAVRNRIGLQLAYARAAANDVVKQIVTGSG